MVLTAETEQFNEILKRSFFKALESYELYSWGTLRLETFLCCWMIEVKMKTVFKKLDIFFVAFNPGRGYSCIHHFNEPQPGFEVVDWVPNSG